MMSGRPLDLRSYCFSGLTVCFLLCISLFFRMKFLKLGRAMFLLPEIRFFLPPMFDEGSMFCCQLYFYAKGSGSRIAPTPQAADGKITLLKQCFCRLTRKHARTFWWWQVGLGGNPYVQILSKSYSLSHGQSFVGQRFLQPEMDSDSKWCNFFHHSSQLLPNYVAPSICQPMNQVLRLAKNTRMIFWLSVNVATSIDVVTFYDKSRWKKMDWKCHGLR